jgi:3D (Asp-Asp-Asp) domain-containing protein
MTDFRPLRMKSGRKILIIVALAMACILATGFVWAHKNVHIIADGADIIVSTLSSKPETVLEQAGVVLNQNDEYRLSSQKLQNGTTIEVFRAVPVTLSYQGNQQTIVTGKPTVGELAASMDLIKENIKLIPGAETRIQAGMNIQAVTLSEKVVERERPEPFTVVHQPDPTMEKGTEEVVEEGRDGIRVSTVKLHFADSSQVAEEVLAEKVTAAPTPRIIRVGTRDTVDTSRGAVRFRRVTTMEASAYLPTDGSSHGITASGIPARHGVVAVDPDVIPLGTRLYVPGYGLALAADTGGAIVGNRIDLCMENYSEAWSFGRRTVRVYILE